MKVWNIEMSFSMCNLRYMEEGTWMCEHKGSASRYCKGESCPLIIKKEELK